MPTPDKYSRYRFSLLASDVGGRAFLTDPPKYGYRAFADNILHQVNDGDTWWSIAAKYYATIERGWSLYWVVCDYQPTPVHDPTIPPITGETVFVPSLRTVLEEILSERRRRAGVVN